jgi:hypothetical protein
MPRSKGYLGEFDYIPKQWFWKPPNKELTEDKESGWKKGSIRTGVLARKVGMSTDWSEWSRRYALTYLQLENVTGRFFVCFCWVADLLFCAFL